jgi:hypothetical protein
LFLKQPPHPRMGLRRGKGAPAGRERPAKAARPAEPLRRRTIMRDRSLSTLLLVVHFEPLFFLREDRSALQRRTRQRGHEWHEWRAEADLANGLLSPTGRRLISLCRVGQKPEGKATWRPRRRWANPDGAIAQKGGRPQAALSLGRKRPRRAYASLSPHRNNLMLRRSNCKHVSLAQGRS